MASNDKILNKETATQLGIEKSSRPVKVLQFGEGNFLRAFIDWMIYEMNKKDLFNGNVSIVQPLEHGMIDKMSEQDYLYTLYLRGVQNGEVRVEKNIIDVVERGLNVYRDFEDYLKEADNPDLKLIVSNTTEAGIVYRGEDESTDKPPVSFPAKLLLLLKRRYETFGSDPQKALMIMPCELIDRNGDNLKKVLKRLAEKWYPEAADFTKWLTDTNVYFNTLVDRIVSGYPREEAEALCSECGYTDNLIDTGEIFHFLVIEAPERYQKELPLVQAGLDVKWTDDMTPYRTRKVRILNGAHTMTVLAAYLCGLETVKDCMDSEIVSAYIKKGIYEEIIPTLDLPDDELNFFGGAVLERFSNPYIRHLLLSISLNSVSKFKTRVLPSLLEFTTRKGSVPELLSFSLAALVLFYKGQKRLETSLSAVRAVDGAVYEVKDSPEVLDDFFSLWSKYGDNPDCNEFIKEVLGREVYWEEDLNQVPGLTDKVASYLDAMLKDGVEATMKKLVS
ncbi:MAG: tagaturonate reductase [Spirochaetales bacterium]|nr:tagaturonate reductase [Spirochaetales bacterium]